MYGAENWKLLESEKKYIENFNTWCWGRMEKITWSYRVDNEDVLPRVIEERNNIHTVKRQKVKWIGLILGKNCLLKHIIEGQIGEMERRRRRREQLLDDCKKNEKILGV